MALRLAGESYSVVQGLDGQGWLRSITAGDALPGLTINQKGSGLLGDFQQNGTTKARMTGAGALELPAGSAGGPSLAALGDTDTGIYFPGANRLAFVTAGSQRAEFSATGDLVLTVVMDAQQTIKNSSAANNGRVTVDDTLQTVNGGDIRAQEGNPGTMAVGLLASGSLKNRALFLAPRSTHIADADMANGEAYTYAYVSGSTRQLVTKTKDGGVVYTGTMNLA